LNIDGQCTIPTCEIYGSPCSDNTSPSSASYSYYGGVDDGDDDYEDDDGVPGQYYTFEDSNCQATPLPEGRVSLPRSVRRGLVKASTPFFKTIKESDPTPYSAHSVTSMFVVGMVAGGFIGFAAVNSQRRYASLPSLDQSTSASSSYQSTEEL
jgi:hypothetical protein